MIPGTIYEIEIDLRATSNVFLHGHRIGVYITSSYFPLWDRNLNTGDPISTGTRTKVAHNVIYHNKKYPSHIKLPIVPDEQTRMSTFATPSTTP